MCATRAVDIIDATRDAAPIDGMRVQLTSALSATPAEEPLVAAREVEAVAPGYGEDEQHFLEWLVLSLLLGRRRLSLPAGVLSATAACSSSHMLPGTTYALRKCSAFKEAACRAACLSLPGC